VLELVVVVVDLVVAFAAVVVVFVVVEVVEAVKFASCQTLMVSFQSNFFIICFINID
jgi:hypothetical protein